MLSAFLCAPKAVPRDPSCVWAPALFFWWHEDVCCADKPKCRKDHVLEAPSSQMTNGWTGTAAPLPSWRGELARLRLPPFGDPAAHGGELKARLYCLPPLPAAQVLLPHRELSWDHLPGSPLAFTPLPQDTPQVTPGHREGEGWHSEDPLFYTELKTGRRSF